MTVVTRGSLSSHFSSACDQLVTPKLARGCSFSGATCRRASGPAPYIGEESNRFEPLARAVSRTSRRCSARATSKVFQVPMPTTGTSTPELPSTRCSKLRSASAAPALAVQSLARVVRRDPRRSQQQAAERQVTHQGAIERCANMHCWQQQVQRARPSEQLARRSEEQTSELQSR